MRRIGLPGQTPSLRNAWNVSERRPLPSIQAVWLARQDYAKARSFFEQALAVAPEDYAAQFELGIVAQRQGQFKEALQRFETGCKAAPEASECGQALQALREKAK